MLFVWKGARLHVGVGVLVRDVEGCLWGGRRLPIFAASQCLACI